MRGAFLLALAVFALRAAYLIWVCPFELWGDEAHYWEWSRRPSLSYYSKGPGVAWAIAASTRLLGDGEWAVRLPAALFGSIGILAAAGLARDMAEGQPWADRAALLGAVAFTIVPAHQVVALVMTIDGPYVACWLLACWAAWRARSAWHEGRAAPGWWLAAGAAMGLGFLFKYTIILLVPGLILAFRLGRTGRPPSRAWWAPALAGLAAVALAAPVLIWNAGHGWPTVTHLLGRVHLPGGDEVVRQSWAWRPRWTLELLGAQVLMIGPLLAVMVWGLARAWRKRGPNWTHEPAAGFAVATALPILVFYGLLSLLGKVQGNWPLAGYAVLTAWLGTMVARQTQGGPWLRGPVTWVPHRLWRFSLIIGAVVALGVLALPAVEHLPPLASALKQRANQRRLIDQVERLMRQVESQTGHTPAIFTDRYQSAGILAYYLPGRPVVRSAAHLLGGRPSSYDFFDDTRFDDPNLQSQPIILVGAPAERWAHVFDFGRIDPDASPGTPVVLAVGWEYRGPRAPHR